MSDPLRLATLAICAAAAIATLAMGAWVGDLSSPAMYAFIAWNIAPYALLFAVAWPPRISKAAKIVLLATAVVFAVFGIWILIEAFFVAPDPQAGLVMIFIPVYQFIAFAPAFVAAHLLEKRARR